MALAATMAWAQSEDRARITAHWTPLFGDNRAIEFVRHPDTTCACLSDTTMGPSLFMFGARRVLWKIQGNSGTCSLVTVQVSNNDTAYVTPPGTDFTVINNFAVGDSLNTGGVLVTLIPTDSTRTGESFVKWRYSRVFVRSRTGYTTTTASAGPTVACRSKSDSLRWKAYVQWTAP